MEIEGGKFDEEGEIKWKIIVRCQCASSVVPNRAQHLAMSSSFLYGLALEPLPAKLGLLPSSDHRGGLFPCQYARIFHVSVLLPSRWCGM